jgi:hypothetical protein
MSERQAEVRLELGGGAFPPAHGSTYGVPSPLFHGEIKLPIVGITFSAPFCSKHPNVDLYGSNCCPQCEEETKQTIAAFLQFPTAALSIDCVNVNHTHECRCHLGHQCQKGCPTYDQLITRQSEDSDGEPTEPHPLFQMAAEAPSDVMRGVYERLHQLEQDNAALKNLVTKMLTVLPEGPRNAAMTAAIREKLGLEPEHEAVGSAQSVEDR